MDRVYGLRDEIEQKRETWLPVPMSSGIKMMIYFLLLLTQAYFSVKRNINI